MCRCGICEKGHHRSSRTHTAACEKWSLRLANVWTWGQNVDGLQSVGSPLKLPSTRMSEPGPPVRPSKSWWAEHCKSWGGGTRGAGAGGCAKRVCTWTGRCRNGRRSGSEWRQRCRICREWRTPWTSTTEQPVRSNVPGNWGPCADRACKFSVMVCSFVSKGVVEPRDTKGKAAKCLRMVRRSQSYHWITASLEPETVPLKRRWTSVETVRFWWRMMEWPSQFLLTWFPQKKSPSQVARRWWRWSSKIWTRWVTTEWCFEFDNEPSILAQLRAVKLAWTFDVVQKTSAEGDPRSNGAAESSVNVVKGHVRSIKLAVESDSSVELPAEHDLLTWLVPDAASMHAPSACGGSRRPDSIRRKRGKARCSPLGTVRWASVVDACAAIQPSSGPSGFTIWTRKALGANGWIKHVVYWHRRWSAEGPNNQTIARRTMDRHLAGRDAWQWADTKRIGRW